MCKGGCDRASGGADPRPPEPGWEEARGSGSATFKCHENRMSRCSGLSGIFANRAPLPQTQVSKV